MKTELSPAVSYTLFRFARYFGGYAWRVNAPGTV